MANELVSLLYQKCRGLAYYKYALFHMICTPWIWSRPCRDYFAVDYWFFMRLQNWEVIKKIIKHYRF